MTLTDDERQILDQVSRLSPGSVLHVSPSAAALDNLVRLGFMERTTRTLCGGDFSVFWITEAGREALRMDLGRFFEAIAEGGGT